LGHSVDTAAPRPGSVPHARLGLWAIFGSTFFELVGYFMLMPWLLLRLKGLDVSTALAGLFAASGWVGIFLVTPFASAVTRRLGRRPTLWLSGAVPVLAGLGFGATLGWEAGLWLWFGLKLLSMLPQKPPAKYPMTKNADGLTVPDEKK
jgi:hypothetical protein